MKIRLRGFVAPETGTELADRGAGELVGPISGGMFFEAAWPDDNTRAFIDKFRYLEGIDFNVWMEFSNKEVSGASRLLVRPAKVIHESGPDFDRMRAHIDTLPWRGDDPETRYRLIDRAYVSRYRLSPMNVAGYGEWSSEYVAHESVIRAFSCCGLTGLDTKPVIDTASGMPAEGMSMLYTEDILPERMRDLTSPRINSPHPEERGYERFGCLCYPAVMFENSSDFCRTGENLVSFEFPEWVISRAAVECYRNNRMKGWRFEPVLSDMTREYDEYLAMWESLYESLSEGKYTIRSMRPWKQND